MDDKGPYCRMCGSQDLMGHDNHFRCLSCQYLQMVEPTPTPAWKALLSVICVTLIIAVPLTLTGYVYFPRELLYNDDSFKELDYLPASLSVYNYSIVRMNKTVTEDNKTITGQYDPTSDTIDLYAERSPATLLHEIGHRVIWTTASYDEREAWKTMNNVSNDTVVSDYAGTNWDEDFAESFMCYHIPDNVRYCHYRNNEYICSYGCKQYLTNERIAFIQAIEARNWTQGPGCHQWWGCFEGVTTK